MGMYKRMWVILLILWIVGAGAAYAQFSGAIEGTVQDPTGAVVPKAKITLSNLATGVTAVTQTNASGYYRFPSLGPGNYKVTAQASGFSIVTETNINLTAMSVRDVSLTLRPSTVTTKVEVSANPTAVQTDEPTISSVISTRQVQELPIEGRNIFAVVGQTPGVTGTDLMGSSASGTDVFYATTTPAVAAGGAPNHGNTYLLDGISLDDSPSGGDSKLVPNPDSVQEVVSSTTNYSAEFGGASGLIVQITSKTGTNHFHGDLFEQHQDNALTARTYFQNVKNLNGQYINPFRRNEFGGSLGGPIFKDRTFFFGSWDQVISNTTSVGVNTVETPAFVSFMKNNYPQNLSTTLLTSYPATIGPPTSILTVAQVEALQGAVPDAQHDCSQPGVTTGPDNMPCGMALLETANGTSNSIHNGYQWNVRIDQTFHQSRDRIYGNVYRTHLVGPWDNGVRQAFDINFPQDAWFGAINYTHIFSPSVLNEAAAGYTRTSVDIPCKYCNLLPVGVNGMVGFGDGFAPTGFAQNNFEWRDMLSVVHGRQAFKMGFDIYHNQDFAPFTVPDNRQQSYGFDTVFDFASDAPSNYGPVSFDPKTGGIGNNNKYFLDSTYDAYVQDDWKVKSDLTLDLGLRWFALSNPSEAHGNLSTLTMGTGSTLLQQVEGISVGLNPNPADRHPFINPPRANFAPRFGFAWQPFGKQNWSIRGGAGIFFDRGGNTNWSDTESGNPPIVANFTASIHNPSAPQPPPFELCASSTFPFNCPLPPDLVSTLPPLNPRGGFGNFNSIGGPDPHLKLAYAENYFFGIQHQFAPSWIGEIDYMHVNTIHEYSITNVNRKDGINHITFSNGVYIEQLGALPNPYFAAINFADNRNGSNYNGLTVSLRKSYSHGFSAQAAFTVEKTIDLMSTVPGVQKGAEYSEVIDAYNINAQRGVSSEDVPKQLSFNGLWDIPTPPTENKLLRAAVKGWEITALGTVMAGYPATVFTSAPQDDFNLDGQNYDLPNKPSFAARAFGRSQYLNGTFQAGQFPLPVNSNGVPLGHEGNIGRNTFWGPGFAETDAAVAKNIHLPWFNSAGAKLQLRVDAFNVFNRVNLQGWDTNLADPNFGKAGGTAQARTLQLSSRISF